MSVLLPALTTLDRPHEQLGDEVEVLPGAELAPYETPRFLVSLDGTPVVGGLVPPLVGAAGRWTHRASDEGDRVFHGREGPRCSFRLTGWAPRDPRTLGSTTGILSGDWDPGRLVGVLKLLMNSLGGPGSSYHSGPGSAAGRYT